jgi:hypothetical protein
MHVFLRDEQVRLRMERVDAEGLLPDGSDLVAIAFFVDSNENPSFRALLPPDTLETLHEMLDVPVTLGVLAEEPENEDDEIRAMVGLAVPIDRQNLLEGLHADNEDEEPDEPWRASAGSTEAWRGDSHDEPVDPANPATAILAFAPLVRLKRQFPDDFGEELADLLESALAGSTRPANEARVDRLLEDL